MSKLQQAKILQHSLLSNTQDVGTTKRSFWMQVILPRSILLLVGWQVPTIPFLNIWTGFV